MRMRLYSKNYIAKKHKIFFLIICIFFTIVILLIRMQTVFERVSSYYVSNIAQDFINTAMSNALKENKIIISDIPNTDQYSGKVSVFKTDTRAINTLKSTITQNIQSEICEHHYQYIYIPFGSFIPIKVFASIGPQIPIKVMPISISQVKINNTFSSAGINQTKHSIYLSAEMKMSVFGILSTIEENVSTSALISEVIIVGDVPDYYSTGMNSDKFCISSEN